MNTRNPNGPDRVVGAIAIGLVAIGIACIGALVWAQWHIYH